MDRRAILFGADTFLGHALARTLLAEGVVTAIARRWDARPSDLTAQGADDVVVDFHDPTSLADAFLGKNWVFWASSPGVDREPEDHMSHAVDLARKVVAAGREAGIDRIVASAPASICWRPGLEAIDESSHYLPGSARDARLDAFYALHQTFVYAAADGVDVVTLASALIVGDGAPALRVAVPRDGREVDVVHVDEAARAHVRAAASAGWGELFLLGGHAVERRELPDLIPAPRAPGLLGRGGSDPRAHLVDPGVRIDPRRAIAELDFDPHFGVVRHT